VMTALLRGIHRDMAAVQRWQAVGRCWRGLASHVRAGERQGTADGFQWTHDGVHWNCDGLQWHIV
jgi:hypothetical protein